MTKRINTLPSTIDDIISLGNKALTGAVAIGAGIPLTINTTTAIAANLHDLIGDPATPLVPGKQAKYTAQKTAVKDAYAGARAAKKAGRAFCMLAIDVLKPVLGGQWNTQWNAAGFYLPSLKVPANPTPILIRLREYFNANPAQEVAALNVNATTAQLRLAAIQSAELAVAQARDLLLSRKADRDASLSGLRKRLSGLRGELEQRVSAEDGRWYDFGFRRPADGSIPSPVTGIVITPAGSGQLVVTWEPSARAENYRVTWKPNSSSDPAIDAGLFTDPQAVLSSVPSSVTITVTVSARNSSGETLPTEAAITLP